jgi:anti-anti-sigma regulatory factor
VSDLQDEILDLLEKQSPVKLLVDFEAVGRCTTEVISIMLRAKKRLHPRGAHLGLCGMKDVVREAYQLLNLDGTVFMIYADRERGVRAMSQTM